jgi:hypothetical protein
VIRAHHYEQIVRPVLGGADFAVMALICMEVVMSGQDFLKSGSLDRITVLSITAFVPPRYAMPGINARFVPKADVFFEPELPTFYQYQNH